MVRINLIINSRKNMKSHQISSLIAKIIREKNEQLNELRTAKKASYRVKSLRAGEDRRHDVGREQAAFVQQKEKSPGLQPRNIKPDEARKHNKKITFSKESEEKESKSLTESYDFMIEKPAGYGTFMTAQDLGIKFESAFHHHPSVVKEMYRRKTKRKTKNGVVFTNN